MTRQSDQYLLLEDASGNLIVELNGSLVVGQDHNPDPEELRRLVRRANAFTYLVAAVKSALTYLDDGDSEFWSDEERATINMLRETISMAESE